MISYKFLPETFQRIPSETELIKTNCYANNKLKIRGSFWILKCYPSLILDWELMFNELIDNSLLNGALGRIYLKSRV